MILYVTESYSFSFIGFTYDLLNYCILRYPWANELFMDSFGCCLLFILTSVRVSSYRWILLHRFACIKVLNTVVDRFMKSQNTIPNIGIYLFYIILFYADTYLI